MYTPDAGCLYLGMLLTSTNLTSPGPNERSLCLQTPAKLNHTTSILIMICWVMSKGGENGARRQLTYEDQARLNQLVGLLSYQNLEKL